MDIVKLREMLEAELSNPELSQIDKSFYSDYDSLFKALKLGAESSRERGEDVEELLYLEQLKIAEGLMREILRVRLHKLIDIAFSGTSPSDLIEEERRILLILRRFIEREELALPSLGEDTRREKEIEDTSQLSTKTPVFEAYIVMMDVPRVLDETLHEFGPMRAGDLVVLPKSLGEVLLKRGAAQKVRISF